jgi:hypothetical protein
VACLPEFDPDYQKKILWIRFKPESRISSEEDLAQFKDAWLLALKSWHSPYKAVMDLGHLSMDPSPALIKGLQSLASLMKTFFLKQAASYPLQQNDAWPFPSYASLEEASQALGLRPPSEAPNPEKEDFRSQVLLESRFLQHTIELSFSGPVTLDSKEKILVLKQKLLNHLRQWHSPWNLFVDCQNLTLVEKMVPDLIQLETFFKGFHLKKIVGHSNSQGLYPFPVYRARHKAAVHLENEGVISGESAQCSSKKRETPF